MDDKEVEQYPEIDTEDVTTGQPEPVTENRPGSCVALIWVLIAVLLIFVMYTSIGDIQALLNTDACCGYQMELGSVPLAVSIPFYLCIIGALIDMVLLGTGLSTRHFVLDFFLCTTTLFETPMSWITLYQRNQTDAIVFCCLTAIRILLHVGSMRQVKSRSCTMIFLVALVQFLALAGTMVLLVAYLSTGGICYLVEGEQFSFTGCVVCPDGTPPNSAGQCVVDGNNMDASVINAVRGTYCSADTPNANATENFCFFEYN